MYTVMPSVNTIIWFLMFQLLYFSSLFLASWHWLRPPIQRYNGNAKSEHLYLIPTQRKIVQYLTIEYDVCCRFLEYTLCEIKKVPFYS